MRLLFAGLVVLLTCSSESLARAADRQAPEGMFKDLDDGLLGDALVVRGKQLFIDDHVIESLDGARKVLNQPRKHPGNPLITRDRPSDGTSITYGSIVRDDHDGMYKLWYQIYRENQDPNSVIGYATSSDGITWEKPAVNAAAGDNTIRFEPHEPWVVGAGVMLDPRDPDPARRFKMLYSGQPDGKSSSLSTRAAYSADGILWKGDAANPLIPFSDTQANPFWDAQAGRYVAFLRYGPPNVRHISRIESEDFTHWSPKVTVLRPTALDGPFLTQFYMLAVMPYEGVYLGLICAYHGETIQPIADTDLWKDRKDVQLAFSRNGLTWQRVGAEGAIPHAELSRERDWKSVVQQGVFLPNGAERSDWDWGVIHPFQSPLVVDDEIRIYYQAWSGRNWWNYHKDENRDGYGLATLRLDGFVSVESPEKGMLTTKPLVFIGDALEVNANAKGGTLTVEAIDENGDPIAGFSAADCTPIASDGLRHVVTWNGSADCQLLQARPIRLRFHLKHAKLYSFTPRIKGNHYLQAYD